jgi:hypothetical protein
MKSGVEEERQGGRTGDGRRRRIGRMKERKGEEREV